MIYNSKISLQIAKHLLEIGAVKISIEDPFIWTSQRKSPVYCDNRLILQHPEIRNLITQSFAMCLKEHFTSTQVIAGVSTAGIAPGVLLANFLNLPFIYCRPDKKKWGLKNQIEGHVSPGQKVLVVEDLVSTAGSSLAVIDALRHAGTEVIGLISIFSYELQVAQSSILDAGILQYSLCNYKTLQEINKQLIDLED